MSLSPLFYFAHDGVAHVSTAEATAHRGSSTAVVIFAVTALIVCIAGFAIYELSTASNPKRKTAKADKQLHTTEKEE
jgi:hypothetical protein